MSVKDFLHPNFNDELSNLIQIFTLHIGLKKKTLAKPAPFAFCNSYPNAINW